MASSGSLPSRWIFVERPMVVSQSDLAARGQGSDGRHVTYMLPPKLERRPSVEEHQLEGARGAYLAHMTM